MNAQALDRSEINRCLAKAIAYKQCGKDKEAMQWGVMLIDLLELGCIIAPSARAR